MIKPARWYHMAVAATAVVAGSAGTVDAQGPAPAPIVVEVRLVGLRTVDEDSLRDLIDIRLGEPLNPDTLDQDIKKLSAFRATDGTIHIFPRTATLRGRASSWQVWAVIMTTSNGTSKRNGIIS